jgi:hypothetical protein
MPSFFLSTPRFFVFRSFLFQEVSDCRSVVSISFLPEGSVADPYVFEPPDPDPLVPVRGTDPDPDQAKIVRKKPAIL